MASRIAQMAKSRGRAPLSTSGTRAPPAPSAPSTRTRSVTASRATVPESVRRGVSNEPATRTQKRPRTEPTGGASSSRGANLEVTGVAVFDTREETRLKELLSKMEALSLEEYTALKIDERPPLNTDVVPLNQQPRLYEDSSVIADPSGSIALELFTHSLLPRDKMMLLERAAPEVEIMGASHINQVSLCLHQLSLSSSYQKRECDELRRRLEEHARKAEDDLKKVQDDLRKTEDKLADMARELKKVRAEDVEHQKLLLLAQQRLAGEKQQLYETGVADGRRQEASLTMVARARGVKDFLNSTLFENLVMSKALDDHLDGYYKAIDLLKNEGKLIPEFDADQYASLHEFDETVRPARNPGEVLPFQDFPEFEPIVEEVTRLRQEAIRGQGSQGFMRALDATVEGAIDEVTQDSEIVAEREYPAPLTIAEIMEEQIQTPPPAPVEVPASEPGPSGVETATENDPAPE